MSSKMENTRTRYCVQWDAHARHMCTILCSLMEHQSLVDLAICCGTNTIHAHKCVLAANSPYFREHLEKNSAAEQVIINGLDFAIVKSIVEFMYCGETNILDEHLKYMIAAAKFFQMRGLQALVSDRQDASQHSNDDQIHIPSPIFVSKKPKYPSTYRPLNNSTNMIPQTPLALYKNPLQNDPYMQRRLKRKYVRSEAEKACAKEAAASRLALEALQKELASTSQIGSFVIEESCTETTVENFIPHTDESFIENLNNIESVPLQVVNYADLNTSVLTPTGQIVNVEKANTFVNQEEAASDKIKRILGSDIPSNVEIMFKTSDGNFVSITDEVLQNLSGGTLQYQVIDENGQAGELQELRVQDKNPIGDTIQVFHPGMIDYTRNDQINQSDSFPSFVQSGNDMMHLQNSYPEMDSEIAKSGEKLSEDVFGGQAILKHQPAGTTMVGDNFSFFYKPIFVEPSEAQPSSSENNANSSLSDMFDVSMKSDVEDPDGTRKKKRKDVFKKTLLGSRKLRTMNVDGLHVDDYVDYNNININSGIRGEEEDGSSDYKMKKMKLLKSHKPYEEMSFSPVLVNIDLDKTDILECYSSRKTRSSQKFEDGELVDAEKRLDYDGKSDRTRRIMPNRKKK